MSEENAVAGNTENTQQAAAEGVQQDAGLVTQESQQAAAEGGESEVKPEETGDTTNQETAGAGTEEKKKLSFEERMAQIEEKHQRELADIEARVEERLKSTLKDFEPVELETQVQRNVLVWKSRMREIETEVNLSEDGNISQDLVDEYNRLNQTVVNAEKAIDENRAKRLAWEEKNQTAEKEKAIVAAMNRRIAEAAPIVAQSLNVTEEQWKTGETWFIGQRRKNPALDLEYRERVWKDGEIRALNWAAKYVIENMAKEAEANKAVKEDGKNKTVTGDGGGGGDTGDFKNIKTWSDLMKLPSRDINRFAKEHPKRFEDMNTRRK